MAGIIVLKHPVIVTQLSKVAVVDAERLVFSVLFPFHGLALCWLM